MAGVSGQDQDLAKAAKAAFDSHRYESCLSFLNKLLDSRRHDSRVAHNVAVAQYMLSNLTHTDVFRKTLQSVSMQFERDMEEGGGDGDDVTIGDKGILLYNQALIHLRLHQNTQATHILQKLFRAKDTLGHHLAIDVCILLIEVCISTYQLSLASAHIDFVEAKLFADSSRDNADFSPEEVENYRCKLFYFKARLGLLHGDGKSCKKDIKGYTNVAGSNASAVLLKANVEYLKHNYHKSLKVLSSAPKSPLISDSGECLSAFLFNNMASIHFHLSSYHLGAYYLGKAIEENDSALNGFPPSDRATPLSGRPLSVLGVNCRHILLYNLGLQQLFAGHPLAAFDSLLEVVQVYHANPRLWLRLAEACIVTHVKNSASEATLKFKSKTVRAVFGKGYCRKLVVAPLQNLIKSGNLDSHHQSAAMPAPTLEFSAICLKNALFLLSSCADGVFPTLPGPPIKGEAITSLRSSILACMSYVALGLGDPVVALSHAKQMLALPNLSGGLQYIGRLYAAEAHVLLERIPEAMQMLNPDTIVDVSLTEASSEQESGDAHQEAPPPLSNDESLSSVTEARASMLYNLATVFCVMKEHDKAKQALQKAIPLFKGTPPKLALLSAYIELAKGNTSQALQIIRKNHLTQHSQH